MSKVILPLTSIAALIFIYAGVLFYQESCIDDVYMQKHSGLIQIHVQHLEWRDTGVCGWDVTLNGGCDNLEKTYGNTYFCGPDFCCEADANSGVCKNGGHIVE